MATWACRSCGGENQQGTRFCGHCGTPASPTAAPARETESLRRFVTDQVADRLLAAGGLPPEERRLVTALFADLSGFTVLADRLDSEQLLEVVDPVIAALSNVVGRYDGYVEKYAGDALLALFGAPVSHEDDPERALFVALEMHAELARVCSELPSDRRELTLHVGINSGHGIARILGSEARMDYAVLGDFVVLAQRLESAAPPGATYVSDSTYGLTQHRFEFEPVGELTLKGKSEAVLAWRLVRERPRSAGRTSPTRRLVGRKRELEAVSNALDELARKRGGALAVTGEAGVGKSRLTAEARRLAESAGLRWLQACCVSYGAGLPYRPYLELLREEAGARREDKPTDVADRLDVLCSPSPEARPAFARLLGVPGDLEVRDLEPEPFRRALHDAFAAWLGALAAEQPAVLAIEDVHWADPSSLALTGELAARDAVPLILYLIARPEASASLAEIAPAARRIELEPLDEAGVATLIEGMLGESPPGLAALVHERTGGNPFFVEEVVRALEETGALRHEAGRLRVRGDWTGDDVPATIEGVLSARIDLLPRSAAVALQTAAVIGRRVPIPLLAAVADTDDLDAALERLVAGGYLDPLSGGGEARLTFHHALMQETAYRRLLRRMRRELHNRVAEAAERLYGAGDDVVDLLASHLYLGEAGAKAVEYLRRAGQRARLLYANGEAIVHLSRALELTAKEPEFVAQMPELQIALADVHELVGDYEQARALYEAVRTATGDLHAWRGLASTLRKQGRFDEALALVAQAPLDADDGSVRLEQAWTLSVAGRFEEAISVVENALEAAGDRRETLVGHLLLQRARAEAALGRGDPALEHGLEAVRIFEVDQDSRGLATALRIAGNAYAALGRFDDAAAALRRGLELAGRVGSVEEIGGCLVNLGQVELERGAVAEAIACDRRAIAEFERVGHGSGRAVAYGNLAEKLMVAGEHEEALHYAETALELAKAIGHTPTIADAERTAARLLLKQGRPTEAVTRAEAAAAAFRSMGAAEEAENALQVAVEARADQKS